VVAVAVGDIAREDRGDDEGTGDSDLADDIVENTVVAPDLEGFVEGFREAEVGYAGKRLMDPEVVASGKQFLGAEEAELIPVVGGHNILSALSAVEGEEGSVDALVAALVGEHSGVFVVGVGDDEDEAGAGVKLLKALPDCGCATVNGERRCKGRGIVDRSLCLQCNGIAEERSGQSEAKSRVENCIQSH